MSIVSASPSGYSLATVLAVANIHPFYNPDVRYPPTPKDVQAVIEDAKRGKGRVVETALVNGTDQAFSSDSFNATLDTTYLRKQPLLWKKDLYATIQRLINDSSPDNTYRHSVYTSITGGGGTSTGPLFFATDVHENRAHRAIFGNFLRSMGLVSHTDWIVSVHTAGGLYRSLDLSCEILENAGASVLAAGSYMSTVDVIKLIIQYKANVISGDASQIVQIAHYISTLSAEDRAAIKIDKIIYTSEGLVASQRDHIIAVLGPVKICSILGSAEGGPYAVSCPHLVEDDMGEKKTYRDFVFDERLTIFEILPIDTPEPNGVKQQPDPLGLGQQGMIAQTSLTRRRNPVVRYVTGDIGSLHRLPESARTFVSEEDWPHLRILRLEGRDHRFSFSWDGEYIDFQGLASILNEAKYAVLQWQVVIQKMEPSTEASLEIRLLRAPGHGAGSLPGDDLKANIRAYCKLRTAAEYRFRVIFLENLDGFVRSGTGRKIVKFVNRLD